MMRDIAHKLNDIREKIIFVCSSPYNILVAVLLITKANLYEKTCIVMPTYSKKNLEYYTTISARLLQMNIQSEVINKHNIFWRAVGFADIQNRVIMVRIFKKLRTEKNAYYLVNHTWDRDKVAYPASLYFKYCKKAIFIEEGSTQFVTPKEHKLVVALKRVYGNQTDYWKDVRLEDIYVQNPDRFIGYHTEKMRPFSLNVSLNREEEKRIIDIFMNESEKESLSELRCEKKGIIFSQCFSEDGYMTEKEKIHIFTELSDYYSQYGKVFLKIHPRDTTEYHIKDVDVVKGSYPSELFTILNIQFDFAIGICTSAIETVNAKVKLNLNEKFLTELKYKMIPLEIVQ